MQQIIVNLISNSLKFTNQGHIKIRVFIQIPCLRFEVQDTGLGIAEEEKQNLFRMFGKGQDQASRKNNTRGIGLGLTICRRLVEQFKGEIGFQSTSGKGATFFFTIPLK